MSFARYDLGAKKPSWTRGATQGLMASLGRWGLNELSSDNLTLWHLSKTTRAIRRPSEKDSAADENCSHPKKSPWEVWGTFPYVPVLHYSLNGAVGYVPVLQHSSKSDPSKPQKGPTHTSYLSQTPQTCLCKRKLPGVNFYRFNANNWRFLQI